jgi:hypothetical protein
MMDESEKKYLQDIRDGLVDDAEIADLIKHILSEGKNVALTSDVNENVIISPDGMTYQGDTDDSSKPSGQGVLIFPNGDRIVGEFKDGFAHGSVKYLFTTGRIYNGVFQNGKPHGKGVLILENGARYEGSFTNSNLIDLDGSMILTSPNGDRYEGEFKDGELNGRGRVTFLSGWTYEGEFKDNMPIKANMKTPTGDLYEGEFKDIKPHGQGLMIFRDGRKYEGEFKGGLAHGQGVMTLRDGRKYEGKFKDGAPLQEYNAEKL